MAYNQQKRWNVYQTLKLSKQYIKGALLLDRKKNTKQKNKNAYDDQNAFIRNPINIPVPETKNNLPKIT